MSELCKIRNRERSGSVVECLTRDRGAAGSSLNGITALCLRARHINPSLVLAQPRKTCPFITERLLMGCKESNQNKKPVQKKIAQVSYFVHFMLLDTFKTLLLF